MFSSFSNSARLSQYYKPPIASIAVQTGVQQISNSLISFSTVGTSGTATVSGQIGALAYRNGTYNCSSSTIYTNSAYSAGFAFNVGAFTNGNAWASYGTDYNAGAYLNAVSTTVSGTAYTGDYLQIQFPYSFICKSFSSGPHPATNTVFVTQCIIAGSNDGSSWSLLGIINTATYTGLNLSLASNSTSYSYYRFICHTVTTNSTVAILSKVVLMS